MEKPPISTNETTQLIASDKVEGTAVYDLAGEKLGSVRNFMVNKLTGEVEYAVLQFGGFLGVGADYYPLPWGMLDYDANVGGYRIDLDKSVLEAAPHYADESPPYDRAYGERVHRAYGLEYPFI